MSDAETKLAAARTRLILDKPFLGALVLRLPLKAAGDWCRTTATDARTLYYNPVWINDLSASQVQFALAHEALHCALGHFARRGHRVQRKWDLACDFAINPLLLDEGLKPPPDAQVLDLYRGMAAEEIYPCIEDELDSDTFDDHVWDEDQESEGGQGGSSSGATPPGATPPGPPLSGGESGVGGAPTSPDKEEVGEEGTSPSPDKGEDGEEGTSPSPDKGRAGEGLDSQKVGAGGTAQDGPASSMETAGDAEDAPPPLTAQEKDQLQQQWQRHLAAAAQRAREAGKLSGILSRLAEAALSVQVSWRALLSQYLSQAARDDYTWQRPSRREGEVIWPSLRSHSGDIHVAIDASGSVTDEDLANFLGELNALKGTLPVRITLFVCDSDLAEGAPWVFEPWDELRLPRQFAGGGGTAFTPVFEWIARAGQQPDALVYFTDADGEFPASAPHYPVLWLVKGKAPVPFGQRIQLNS